MMQAIDALLEAVGPTHDDRQSTMLEHAVAEGFPTVGPGAGRVLRLLARLADAREVFEFGSGFGYSASWLARGMSDGRIVLTEYDEDELALAREFLDDAYDVTFAFESGDAMAAVERYDGPFDVVLLDHEAARYAPALARVRSKLRPGGVVVADNVASGPVDTEALVAMLGAESDPETHRREASWDVDTTTEGAAAYLGLVRADPGFETTLLPVEEGLAVSVRVE
ncbi:O-methyltransferase [Salinigranum halophilum]|uniref:O-methyltransferase n=1 Tax=Salinigranum halophilum TaxID=2565931 RepID=UPI0010A881D4|nr:O-methyltransferase [Salinigranum halophilum]